MKLFQNGLITLTYSPDADTLIVTWSNRMPLSTAEMQVSMHEVIAAINKLQCRNLVIDASNTIALIDQEGFKAGLAGFMAELCKTNIQRLARVFTPYPAREENFQELQHELMYPFELQDFSNKEEAIKWLKTRKNKI